MAVKGTTSEGTALDGANVGYNILRRLGWKDGEGLGRDRSGVVLPVAVSGPRLIEGVGLGCEDIPEDKLLTSNVSVLIEEFITDSTRTELKFDPDLAKADRALIHVLAQKHNLGHKSSGKGKERFITVSKRARGQSSSSGQTEADIEAQFNRVHDMGYSNQNRGMGLGFGGNTYSYSAAPPPKSLLKACKEPGGFGPGMGPAKAQPQQPQQQAKAPKQPQQPQQPQQQAKAPKQPQQPQQPQQQAKAPKQQQQQQAPVANKKLPAGTISQWVSTMYAASSQFSPYDHSARQLLGAPNMYPKHGSSTRAWSAVPRPGHSCEWVRVGFKRAVYPGPNGVVIAETSNPGSVVAIRGTSHPMGHNAEASEWFIMWAGLPEWPDDGNARMFAPPLMEQACKRLVSAVEITLDTTQWTTEWWSEIDAVRLDGIPDASHSDKGAKPGGPKALGKVEPVATWIPRMPWEHDAHFYSRARFEIDRFGATPPETREEGMRREAISMVYQNMQVLGCTYAKETEAEVALAAGQKMGNASRNRGTGMAMEGEMRAMEILALVGDAGRPK